MLSREIPNIPFHIPFVSGEEEKSIKDAIVRREFSGDGYFTKKCEKWLEGFSKSNRVMLTSSCTHALEMCAMLCNIQPGDEVIMPSFNYVSAANAFALRGARIVFVDIRADTMNIDEQKIESAITERTKAILVVHYGGVSCEMDEVMKVARAYNLLVIEDAAHCIGAYYKQQHLGTIGDLGTLSFHVSKNIHCGEGGALLLNNTSFIEPAVIIREKGTNRNAFLKGSVNEYSWIELGSSYSLNEISAAFLFAQLQDLEVVNNQRVKLWRLYNKFLGENTVLGQGTAPDSCSPNGHIFFIKCTNEKERKKLSNYLSGRGVDARFHYVPLHTSLAGRKYGRFFGPDRFTSSESVRLLRLPLHTNLDEEAILQISNYLFQFYDK